MIKTTDMLKELYRIYDAINDEYFDNSLPKVFITLQQGKKKNKAIYGTFYPNSWAENQGDEVNEETGEVIPKVSEERFHEISMSAEYFTRPVANWCATLCHEMVHLYCSVNELKETSNNSVYHNKIFKQEAEKCDLIIERADIIGWSLTTPSTDFIEFINTLEVDEDIFSYFRDTRLIASEPTPKKRYVCPMCAMQAQAKKNMDIVCGECELRMDYVDITDPDNPEFIVDYNDGLAVNEGWIFKLYEGDDEG